jgi:hypothetical protein
LLPLGPTVNLGFDHGVLYSGVTNKRPEMTVELAGVGAAGQLLGYTSTVVLVDSGADITMLDIGLLPALGINSATLTPTTVTGVGGNVTAYRGPLLIRLCGQWKSIPVLFAVNQSTNLLGREGAFDAMQLAFVHSNAILLAALRP